MLTRCLFNVVSILFPFLLERKSVVDNRSNNTCPVNAIVSHKDAFGKMRTIYVDKTITGGNGSGNSPENAVKSIAEAIRLTDSNGVYTFH